MGILLSDHSDWLRDGHMTDSGVIRGLSSDDLRRASGESHLNLGRLEGWMGI